METLYGDFTFSVPDGTVVTFYDGLNVLGTAATIRNLASMPWTLGAGNHPIRAMGLGLGSPTWSEAIVPNLGLYRPLKSKFIIDYDHSGAPYVQVPFGAPGDVGLVGDVLGNGRDAFVLYRSGIWYVDSNRDGNVDAVYAFGGLPGDIPLLADMDGDGKADLVIYRGGTWYVSTNRDGVANEIYHFGGAPGDIPLIADMKGDGLTDLIIYRSGTWYVSYARDGTVDATFYFGGLPQDVPFASYWNSTDDNMADPIIFRDGMWFVGTHGVRDGTAQTMFGFGASGDIPLLGTFR
jgi:hypothetical protein